MAVNKSLIGTFNLEHHVNLPPAIIERVALHVETVAINIENIIDILVRYQYNTDNYMVAVTYTKDNRIETFFFDYDDYPF